MRIGATLICAFAHPVASSDPSCARGIRDGDTCCAASCGTCGGTGCGTFPGGADSCCSSHITRSCSDNEAPCHVYGDPSCSRGILAGETCCAASCGTCGGSGCGTRPGGEDACCSGHITRSCADNEAPCHVYPAMSFAHPGVLVSKSMLDATRGWVAAGKEPWKSAAEFSQNSRARNVSSLDYHPTPRAVVECGSYSNPDYGCSDEKRDAEAAYAHALLWYFTSSAAHAKKAIEIMDAWSSKIQDHTNSNGPLQTAWVASVFPRAAEIIEHTYGSWDGASRFKTMLKNVYLPRVISGSTYNGNWELSMIEAAVHIAVFTDDQDVWNKALALWRARTPAYLYVTSDGSVPKGQHGQPFSKSYWYNLDTYVDGVCQETCRDLGHVQYGLAAMVNTAETAWHQGIDLYGEEFHRMLAGLEFHAKYLTGSAVPSWLCGGALKGVSARPMWEIAYNHFHNRKGQAMPYTEQLLSRIRPTAADHHMEWETLTHYDQGSTSAQPMPTVTV